MSAAHAAGYAMAVPEEYLVEAEESIVREGLARLIGTERPEVPSTALVVSVPRSAMPSFRDWISLWRAGRATA
jgi:hypothetical protein